MAITATLLNTTFVGWDNPNATATTTVTSPSVTPGANCLLVVMLSEIGQNTDPFASTTPTSTGSGPTFTVVEKQGTIAAFAGASGVWTGAITSDPGSFTVSATYANVGGSFTIYLMSVYKVTDFDTGTPTGGKEVTTGQAGNGAVTITLDAAPATGDLTLAQCLTDENSVNRFATFGTGTWTTDQDGAASGHQLAYNVGQRSASTSTSVPWSDVNSGADTFGSTQVAVVVKAADTGITGTAANTLDDFTSTASGTFTDWTTFSDGVSATPGATVTGLTNGVLYEFRVRAVNSVGESANSNIVEETPVSAGISGTAANTLSSFTSTASGTFTPAPVTGTAANTLEDFTSAASDELTPWPVARDSTNRKILDQFGNVYLMPGFSSWGLAMRLSDADLTTALEGIAALGWKVVNISIGGGVNVQSDWNAVQYENQAGDDYWTGTPWASSLGAAWSSVDHAQAECERLGMTIMMSFFVSFGSSGIGPDIEAVTNAQMRTTGQAIANRYIDAPNIVWEVEVDDGMSASSTRGRRIDWLFRGITETETTPRLQFVEPALNGTAGFEYITGQGTDPTGYQWFHVSADAMYSYDDNSVEQIESVWGDHTTYPVWDSEPPYAAATHYGGNNNQQMRERNYGVFLEGFCGINYGDEDWWRVDKTGFFTRGGGFDWQDVLTATETIQAGYAWGLADTYCKALDWAPTSSFVTTGESSGDGKTAQGARGSAAVAYIPTNRSVTVDTTIIAGTSNVRLRWFDPVLGTFSTIAASEAQNGSRSVTMPSARGDGTSDFVLVVDDWIEGTATNTLDHFTSSGSGTVSGPAVTGTAANTLASFTSAASGTFTPPPITGTAANVLASFVSTGTGQQGETGVGGSTLANFTSSAAGVFIPAGTGSAANMLNAFTSTGTGTVTPPAITGTAANVLANFTSIAAQAEPFNLTLIALAPLLAHTVGAVTLATRTASTTGITRTADVELGHDAPGEPELADRTLDVQLGHGDPAEPTT